MRRPALALCTRPARPGGFTLVELAVVLAVLGLLAMTMTSGFDSITQAKQRNTGKAATQMAHQAVRAFVLRNKRLPCPDASVNGDTGREPLGACVSSTGWLPYESIGLDIPERGARLRYGVYLGGSGMNLVSPSAGAVDSLDLEGSGGFESALIAASREPPNAGLPHFIQGQTSLVPICNTDGASTALINPAFVVIAPVSNIDSNTGPLAGFEPPNQSFGAASRCFAAPESTANASYDDVVVVESLTSMLGWAMSTSR